MCDQCDRDVECYVCASGGTGDVQAWLDQEDARIAGNVRRTGVSLEFIIGDCAVESPSFCYTVGLFGLRHPELLIFVADPQTANAVLNDLARQVRAGRDLVPGEIVTFEEWSHRLLVEEVPNPGDIVFAANRHYVRPDKFSVPVLQLSLDCVHGQLPGEPGYCRPAWMQPRPGHFSARH